MTLRDILTKSIETGFIDHITPSEKTYRPELLTNDKPQEKKVLTSLLRELEGCNEFWFSVAFATSSGVAILMNTLIELKRKNIKGRIIVSQYLNFTHPEALKKLKKFTNIELKMATEGDFHSKAYLFKKGDLYNLIIGSSNLTQAALCSNKELNLKVSAIKGSELVSSIREEFKKDFKCAQEVTEQFISEYEVIYKAQKEFKQNPINSFQTIKSKKVTPNEMQSEALSRIENLRAQGKRKALLISATGTGKTYLSAFDVQRFKAKKFLFIVHRRTIAIEAMNTFKVLLGSSIKMGIYSGPMQDATSDYIFATIQTISKQEHLKKFNPKHFDYILIDETHRAGAQSYKCIMDYFKPKFLMGMTATPERTDTVNVFKLFDYNIAYEIRLHQALAENMLCPFHYFGVTDLTIKGKQVSDKSDFNLLVSDERVNRITDVAKLYGSDSGTVTGLIFCSRKDECAQLSIAFNQKGYKTLALTGDSSESTRADAIKRLEGTSESEKLDYIFSVDIFNEGIDIPSVNQIIMLRPTQSAIIFVQQLGRGLRKVDSKEYLTVIDFIGNYSNNYLVPISLYGDTSYNKDTLRKLIASGSRSIPGSSTVNFDRIAKERIFQAIDSANMQLHRDLVKDYKLLKFKLGRIPMMLDFEEHGVRDPMLYVKKYKSYYNFIVSQEPDFEGKINNRQRELLELFSNEINNGKRVEESVILRALTKRAAVDLDLFKESIGHKYGYEPSDATVTSCLLNLNFEFITKKDNGKMLSVREIYDFNLVRKDKRKFVAEVELRDALNNDTFKDFLRDSTDYSIKLFERAYKKEMLVNGFNLYQKYSRKDVFRVLNWKQNPVAQNVGGYIVSKDKLNCPIFVNYHKEEGISNTTKYEDTFLDQYRFAWMSKSRRTLNSSDVKAIRNDDMRLPLFIKKSNDEGLEFYYMGDVSPLDETFEQAEMSDEHGKKVSVVKVTFLMSHPVDNEIYEYLSSSF